MRKYAPRKAGARWREAAPDYILDCFDSKNSGERYTVIFGGPDWVEGDGTFGGTWLHFLGMSDAPTHPQGVSMWGDFRAHEAAAYRYRFKHHRVRWLDLPEHIRAHVISRATTEA